MITPMRNIIVSIKVQQSIQKLTFYFTTTQISTLCCHKRKSQRISKIIIVHHLKTMNVCISFMAIHLVYVDIFHWISSKLLWLQRKSQEIISIVYKDSSSGDDESFMAIYQQCIWIKVVDKQSNNAFQCLSQVCNASRCKLTLKVVFVFLASFICIILSSYCFI